MLDLFRPCIPFSQTHQRVYVPRCVLRGGRLSKLAWPHSPSSEHLRVYPSGDVLSLHGSSQVLHEPIHVQHAALVLGAHRILFCKEQKVNVRELNVPWALASDYAHEVLGGDLAIARGVSFHELPLKEAIVAIEGASDALHDVILQLGVAGCANELPDGGIQGADLDDLGTRGVQDLEEILQVTISQGPRQAKTLEGRANLPTTEGLSSGLLRIA